MTDDEAYRIIEGSRPCMGSNYLIHDGVVYMVSMWAMGGVAFRATYRPGDYSYEAHYRAATSRQNAGQTLFKERSGGRTK